MARRIVISFDGTWNTPDNDADLPEKEQVETNARRLYEAVLPQDESGTEQLRWYDEGVGTKWYNRVRGGAFGLGLSENIRQGYKYLVETYQEGDEIFIFGFSRGAYTARSLVGMIRNCGLLAKENIEELDTAYEIYRTRDDDADSEAARFFREKYAREIRIKFLGVWDTVGALGVPLESFEWFNRRLYEFHDTTLSGMVENAFHALALDEHRKEYAPTLWNPKRKPDQRLEQRWFLGAHSDIGGGYPHRQLSDITLKWLMEKATECSLKLDSKRLPKIGEQNLWGKITDSFKAFLSGFYSLLNSRYYRDVCATTFGNENVDETVLERIRKDTNYRPKNTGLLRP